MIDRRYFRYFDWVNFSLTLILLAVGLLFVFSSTYSTTKPFSRYFNKQLFGAITGVFIYFIFCLVDLRKIDRQGYLAYFFILILLIYTFLNGFIGMGAKRWVSLYFFSFQPSELTKLFLPIFLAYYFNEQNLPNSANTNYFKNNFKIRIKEYIFPLIMILVSFFLILKQPDLGTAIIILISGLTTLWIVGLEKKIFIFLGLSVVMCAPFLWQHLKTYQKQRILVLLGDGDTRKERYQLEQSKIAVGSGGLTGKGFLKGTQNKFAFLPEDHTDFIFSVICEEWGFLGGLLIITLFSLLFIRFFYVAINLPTLYEQIIATGLICYLISSVCINIGMVIGILPIVGIPLPLISYGNTNLWVTMASLGCLNNLSIRRFYY
ncbi:rod shape-determining protein RodA [Candidatus Babeliales bacterium]|nr:rod shape-determining protein RodA [Candidatus Babeliales bacterium]